MPITHLGLQHGLRAARLKVSGGPADVYIKALTSGDAVLGKSGTTWWGMETDTTDGSAFKARDHLSSDTVINISTTGVVAKLQFVFIGDMPASVSDGTAGGIRFTITLDSTLSVVSGGYLTVKGGSSTNTYIEIQSSKSS